MLAMSCALGLSAVRPEEAPGQSKSVLVEPPSNRPATPPANTRRPPVLGADLVFADWPHILIDGWKDPEKGSQLFEAFNMVGVRSIRLSFHGFYSPRGPEATARVKTENKMRNEYPWFSFEDYVDFVAAHDLTTVVGINVEEGPEVALEVVQKFDARGIKSKLVAIELSNEPHLNHRPWQPEEYASYASRIIERLTSEGVRFALPLTVGSERNTPTRLSDNDWNRRMLTALTARIDLKERPDVYGVLHLYGGGMRARSVDYFNREVRRFAPKMRYLVTEFNIKSGLEGNPHLTNKYGMEFARRLAEVMASADIEAMYVHAVPYHAILYWSNGRRLATVIGQSDPKLKGDDLSRGWHATPAGKVYAIYSKLAWNGELIFHEGSGGRQQWSVRTVEGRVIRTLLNDASGSMKKSFKSGAREVKLTAPPRSIICFDEAGQELARLTLPH